VLKCECEVCSLPGSSSKSLLRSSIALGLRRLREKARFSGNGRETFPQGLKPAFICGLCSTTKVVPFQDGDSCRGSLAAHFTLATRTRSHHSHSHFTLHTHTSHSHFALPLHTHTSHSHCSLFAVHSPLAAGKLHFMAEFEFWGRSCWWRGGQLTFFSTRWPSSWGVHPNSLTKYERGEGKPQPRWCGMFEILCESTASALTSMKQQRRHRETG